MMFEKNFSWENCDAVGLNMKWNLNIQRCNKLDCSFRNLNIVGMISINHNIGCKLTPQVKHYVCLQPGVHCAIP